MGRFQLFNSDVHVPEVCRFNRFFKKIKKDTKLISCAISGGPFVLVLPKKARSARGATPVARESSFL